MKKIFVFCCLMLSMTAFAPGKNTFWVMLTGLADRAERGRKLQAEDRRAMSGTISAAYSQGFAACSRRVGSARSWFNAERFKK